MDRSAFMMEDAHGVRVHANEGALLPEDVDTLESGGSIMIGDDTFRLVTDAD